MLINANFSANFLETENQIILGDKFCEPVCNSSEKWQIDDYNTIYTAHIIYKHIATIARNQVYVEVEWFIVPTLNSPDWLHCLTGKEMDQTEPGWMLKHDINHSLTSNRADNRVG